MADPSPPQAEIGHVSAPSFWGPPEAEETPELRWPLALAVYDRMASQDAQCISVMHAVTLPVLSTRWSIEQAGASDEVTQDVADNLGLPIGAAQPVAAGRLRDRFSWNEHVRHALLALRYGHMAFEQVYRIDPTTGRAAIRKLAPRMPRTLEKVNVAADGGLVSIEQNALPTQGAGRVTIPVERLVFYSHEREGGNWLGRSLFRAAYKNWLLKDRALRGWHETNDRNGMGIPWYEAAEGETDLSRGLAIATAWRAGDTAGGAGPNGSKMRLIGVEGALPDIEKEVRYHDEQIARSVLAHFLNLGLKTGSYALGSTQADFFVMSLQAVGQWIADTATQHIVEDFVDINYGRDEPAPRLTFDPIGAGQDATAASLKSLVDAGLLYADRPLEEWLRQQLGLPPKPFPAPTPTPAPGGAA